MINMNVVVFGSTGMLGRYVCKYFISKNIAVHSKSRENFNIFELFQEGKLLDELKNVILDNTLVINCAGITNKRPEISVIEMYVINSLFPMILDSLGKKVIHISTDCVFTGSKGCYSVEDEPDALDHYGLSKRFGERLRNTCIIRTSIIGEEKTVRHGYGLLEWVREKSGETISGYVNHYWNGVTCLELAKLIYEFWIVSNSNYDCKNCLTNITSPSPINKYDLVKLISDVYELNITVNPINTPVTCDKTLEGTLITEKSLRKQLEELREFPI